MSAARWTPTLRTVAEAVGRHPSLWPEAAATLVRLARPGWWRRRPFLPVPDEDYWHFRLVTAYGGRGEEAALRPEDVVAYLRWCRGTRSARG